MSNSYNFFETPRDSVITSLSMALLAVGRDNACLASGSCIIVAPLMALTALHVIDDYSRRIDGVPLALNSAITFRLYLRGNTPDGVALIFEVAQIFSNPPTDIVALSLRPACDAARSIVWHKPRIRLSPPLIGNRVACFGYREAAAHVEMDGQTVAINWSEVPTTARGTVRDIYPVKRDSSVINFPAFHFDARVDGGMSGGPVFSEDGRLVGLISTSLPASTDDEAHSSFAAMIYPGLTLDFRFPQPMPPEFPPAGRLYELARCRIIDVDDLELLSFRTLPDSTEQAILRFPIPPNLTDKPAT